VTWNRVWRTCTMPLAATRVRLIPSQPTGRCWFRGRVSFRCRLPGLRRGDPAGQPLVGSLGVIDLIEAVDLALQLLKGARDGLHIKEAEQGLVEAFVLALRRRFIGFPGDRLDPERDDIGDELTDHPTTGRVQRRPVIGQEPLRNPVRGDALPHHRDRSLGGFTPSNMGGDREPGVIVDELEDHAFATGSQNIFGRIQLPARVRRRINEPPERRPRFLPRLDPGNPGLAEDPPQCRGRGDRGHAQRPYLLVDADRAVIQTRLLQGRPNPDRLTLHLIIGPARARPWPPSTRRKSRSLALLDSPPLYRVERLPGDPAPGTEGAHRTPRSIGRPLRNSKTDTRTNRLKTGHPSNNEGEVSPPNTAEGSPI
jgi:hypothetical protein